MADKQTRHWAALPGRQALRTDDRYRQSAGLLPDNDGTDLSAPSSLLLGGVSVRRDKKRAADYSAAGIGGHGRETR